MIAIDRARSLIGTPFVHQGRSSVGIDCVGLVCFAVEYPVEKIPPYGRDPNKGYLEKAMVAAFGEPFFKGVCEKELPFKEGDIVAMQYSGPVRHVGIIANCAKYNVLNLIHTDSIFGEVTEHELSEKWLSRIKYAWRIELK